MLEGGVGSRVLCWRKGGGGGGGVVWAGGVEWGVRRVVLLVFQRED